VITYNAALNRPAYQISVNTNDYGTFPAHYANDGSRHTDYRTSPYCAVTNQDANPWWAVDLGQPMDIYRVDLTTSVLASKETYLSSLPTYSMLVHTVLYMLLLLCNACRAHV